MAALICIVNISLIDNHITDYCYQLTHPYRGPLDYYIPAIQKQFPHPENLTIATNYDELSYEYYLGSRVILGYQNHFQSFDRDTTWHQDQPDVIILRPGWTQDRTPYEYFLQHGRYRKITFPIQDQQVNNLPELYFYLRHRFRSAESTYQSDMASMYVKE
jgi:hypothetical protein